MIDSGKYIFRPATVKDIPFLVETVIQAEKSNTGACGMANHFGISEEELKGYLTQIFEEEVDGCELSVSSFFVAEYEGRVVAAAGGWLEGDNEDGQPSAILKSNLIQYVMPKEVLLKARENVQIAKELSIEREQGTYQREFSYVMPEHQGQMLNQTIGEMHLERARSYVPPVKKIQAHVFSNNKVVVLSHKISGYRISKKVVSSNPRVLEFYPCDTMLLFEKEL